MFIDTEAVCDFYFLYYTSAIEETNNAYKKMGKAIYWAGFEDTFDLLHSIKPIKVIFLYIESYNHVVLNLACRQAGIATYHLEHGLRADYVVGFDPIFSPSPKISNWKRIKDYMNVLLQLKARVRSRRFLLNSVKKLSPDDAEFINHFIHIRRQHNYLETFRQIKSPKRNPDTYISFSPKVFEIHQHFDGLTEAQDVHFIGVPYFDNLACVKPEHSEKCILFIDQPLVEHHLLKWTENHRQQTLANLCQLCKKYSYKLLVKSHPKQAIQHWANPAFKDVIEFVNNEQLPKIAGKVKIVMGFYSTLLMPFAVMPHVLLLTLENHPIGKLNVSKSFIDAGVAHPVYDLDELPWALEHVEQLHQQQVPNKKKFEEEWLYKFDGKAGERLRDILLSDTL